MSSRMEEIGISEPPDVSQDEPQRKKVTFEWNGADLGAVLASLVDASQEPCKFFDLPIANYASSSFDRVMLGGKTVARLPSFRGHADSTREHLRLTVKRSTRSTIRAAAKRRGSRRVILTLVHQLTLTTNIPGDMALRTKTIAQDAYLVIPRG